MKQFLSKKPVALTLEALRLYQLGGGAQTAAALAYYLVMTLFPLLLCVNYFIGLFHINLSELLLSLNQFLPPQVLEVLQEYLEYASTHRSLVTLGLALSTIVFSASAALRTLFYSMDHLFAHTPKNSFLRMGLSVFLSVLFLLTIYLSIVVIFTGNWFFTMLQAHLPELLLDFIPLEALASFWRWVRYLLLFCFVLLLLLCIYSVGTPKGRANKRTVRLSSLLTAGAMVISSLVFSAFIGASSQYSLLYGSLTSLIIMLVWLFFCGNILVLGAVCVRLGAKTSA